MKRASKTCDWWQEMPDHYEASAAPALTVFEPDVINTGLLDADGNPIMRAAEPIGFLARGGGKP